MTDTHDAETQTVFLGRYDPLKIPIILEVLAEHQIFAMTKIPVDETESGQYPSLNEGRRVVMVDGEKVDEALALVDSEVASRLSEMSTLLGDAAPTQEDSGLVPFGFFEPAVARVFLDLLSDAGIGAQPEYPLDRPAPAFARADGRVRVHVEALFLAEAEDILEAELPEELSRRTVVAAEPLRDTDEP